MQSSTLILELIDQIFKNISECNICMRACIYSSVSRIIRYIFVRRRQRTPKSFLQSYRLSLAWNPSLPSTNQSSSWHCGRNLSKRALKQCCAVNWGSQCLEGILKITQAFPCLSSFILSHYWSVLASKVKTERITNCRSLHSQLSLLKDDFLFCMLVGVCLLSVYIYIF